MKRLPIASRFLAICFAIAAATGFAEDSQPITDAERLLFMSDQLKSVAPPATLRYSYSKTGTLEKNFLDTVEVTVSSGGNGKQVATRCLSAAGEHLQVPPIESAEGNPALLCFLERDIREMKRLTGAKNHVYFQKRIRLALAANPEVKPVTVSHNGRQIAAKEIRISPYLDDPNKERFEKYTGKYYVFTLSEQVPGGLYRVESVIPDLGKEQGKGPLVEEVMAYTGSSTGNSASR